YSRQRSHPPVSSPEGWGPMRSPKVMGEAPDWALETSHCDGTWDPLARREPYGDRVIVVVAGVTTCQEGWESQPEARRVTGEPLKPDTATRDAERPKGEKRKRARRLSGNSYGRFSRRAEGKGPRERYLASRLSYSRHRAQIPGSIVLHIPFFAWMKK